MTTGVKVEENGEVICKGCGNKAQLTEMMLHVLKKSKGHHIKCAMCNEEFLIEAEGLDGSDT